MNGATARLQHPEPASAPGFAQPADKPAQAIEIAIGEATAAAATVLCKAIEDFRAGGKLAGVTRAAGGERIAALFELQQATLGEIDFPAAVRREGKLALRRRHGVEWMREHGGELPEAVLDGLIGSLLEILAGVTAVERMRAN